MALTDLSGRRLLQMALVLALAWLAVAVEAAPVGLGALSIPSPDLLFCVLAVWAVREPKAAPVLLVFAVGLMRDFLADLPAGLGALGLVLAIETLKAQRARLARQPFVVEWIVAALVALAMALMLWVGMVISLAQPPYAALLAQQYAVTMAAYPLVALLLRLAFGLRSQIAPGARAAGEGG
ncbi:MAG: rod shape-determining protein MreD [Paracoccaceae bacterium]